MAETLRELVVALSLDSNNFSRNLRTINQQIKEAESTFKLAGAGVQNFEKTIAGTEAKLSMLGNKLTQQNRAVEQYSRALVAANQKLTDTHERQQKLTASLEAARSKMDQAKSAVGNAAAEYKRLASTLGESDSATIMAKENLEKCKEEYKAARDQVKLLEGQLKANTKTLQNNADAVSKAQTNLNNAKAAVRETEAEIRRLTEELYRMQSKWTQAGDALVAFSKKCDTISKSATQIGKTLTRTITTPIVALGAAAIKASIDFESSFTSVRKTVEATEEEYAQLTAASKRMSTQVAASTSEINEVMATGGQLGIATENLEAFTKVMIDLGNSCEDLNADEAATSLAKFANIMSTDQKKFENIGSTLVDLGNNYATTEAAIMQMSMRLAGAGKQVGLTEAQIMGFAAALSSVGIEAQMGGSAFSKALVKMEVAAALGGESLEDFAKVSGMTAEQFKKLWENDPAAAFQAFIVGLSKMDDEGTSAIATLNEIGINEIRLRDTLLRATNATELFSNAQKTATKAWEENTALSVEANKRYATTESKLINLKNTAILFAQQIGDDLNPTIQSLIDKGNDLLASFLELDEGQRQMIIKFAAIAAAAGPAILVLGKMIGAVGKVTSTVGKGMQAVGKFSAAVKVAGGGFSGFAKTLLSSKLAVAALSAALIYGAVQLYDYASGAKAVRKALDGLNDTAEEWKNTAAETFYGNSEGLSFFGMSKEDFARDTKTSREWLNGLLAVWTDGQIETDEIVSEWTESFKSLTASTREELQELQKTAQEGGYTSVTSQIANDISTLDALDDEIASLLKKRQSKLFTEADQIRLQELIDTREAIEVKYNLVPADTDSFDTIRQKVEAEVARAQARGQEVDVSVYENAMVAAAEGMAAVNQAIDDQYDKEYAVIQLIEDGAERQAALEELNARYIENRRTAAQEYAETMASVVMPVWNQEDIQAADSAIDTLYSKLREYSIAANNGDTFGMAKALEDMKELTASMDEGSLTEYVMLLTQIQALLDAGMSEEEVQALFPDIDVSQQMGQIADLTKFVQDHKDTLTGLSGIFSEAVPEEVLKISTDLDMTGAQSRWSEFAENPGAITTQAVIDSYEESAGLRRIQPTVDAFISSYTEVPEGADTSQLTPEGLLAYVEKYAEVTNGADVSGLTPEHITAMVSAYEELASGADVSTLKPSEITAYISKYLEENGVDTTGITPDGITAFVMAYEEVNGGASTRALNPPDVAAIITEYLQGQNIDISKLTPPQIEALVTAYSEATGCDKEELQAEVEARITAYVEAEGVQKPSYIENYVSIVGYDLTAYNEFIKAHPIEVQGVLRVGEMYDNASDVLNDPNAKFYENGKEIPVNLVPANKIDDKTLIAYEADGTMHVLITPNIEGTTESVAAAAEKIMNDYVTVSIFGNEQHLDWGWLNNLLGSNLIEWIEGFNGQLEAFEKNKGTWVTLWGALDGTMLGNIDKQMNQQFSGDNLAGLTTYVSELVAAIQNGQQVSEQDIANLQSIVNFLNNLELTDTGENIRAGVAQGMTEAGWDTDAETVASNLETALNTALGIASPAARMNPTGEFVSAGIGEGAGLYDFSTDAETIASNLETALGTFMTDETLATFGTAAMQGLAQTMTDYSMDSTGSSVGTNVVSAVSSNLTSTSLRSIGVNAMSGLRAGIVAGQSSVVSAMRSAARAAVNAAKSELQIRSPSRVFRDEVGRMTMKGFGVGALEESKKQARTIRNAMRYLTNSAQEGAVAYSNNDNRRTYNQQSSVNLSGNTFYVRSEQDIQSLAVEIATLTRRQQRGKGLRMA